MKKLFSVIFVFAFYSLSAQDRVELFPMNQVAVTSGVFKNAALTDFDYIQKLDPDRLLSPFLREAGLEPKAESYTNW